ncbi:MAG: hypothetical protein IJH65_08875 [Methanobrevibacter sp.]|nr:hypothetical protein [Methanobrevibacter sp.]
MLRIVSFLLLIIFFLLLTYILHGMVRKSKYSIERRYCHCRYIASYIVLMFVFLNKYTGPYILVITDKIINMKQLQVFWDLFILMKRFQLVYMILSLLISNFLIVLISGCLFLLIKILLSNTRYINFDELSLIEKIYHLPWLIPRFFFKESPNNEGYRVTEKGFTIGLWAKWMKYAFLICEVLELGFLYTGILIKSESVLMVASKLVQGWYLLPMLGYLFIEQIQYMLETEIAPEVGSFSSETIDDKLEGNLAALYSLYLRKFKDSGSIIGSFINNDIHYHQEGISESGLNQSQYLKSNDPSVLHIISNHIKEAGATTNKDYQNALIELVNEKSIYIQDVFQGDFLIYLAAYMNYYMSQEKVFLVLCKSEKLVDSFRKELTKAFNRINQLSSVWNIADYHKANGNAEMDVLVISYTELLDYNLIEKRNDFFQYIDSIIMTDVEEICSHENIYLESLFSEFSKIKTTHAPKYVAFSTIDNDSLRISLEYYIGKELHLFKSNLYSKNAYTIAWKEESYNKIQKMMGIAQETPVYIGMEMPIGLVALKYDVPVVRFFYDMKNGLQSFFESMKMSTQSIAKYLKRKLDLEELFLFNDYKEKKALEVLVVQDSSYNLFNAVTSLNFYGGKEQTLLHIVSPFYILREYFADKLGLGKNLEYDYSLYSSQSILKKDGCLKILLEMCLNSLPEEQILKKGREYQWGELNVPQLLEESLQYVLNDHELHNVHESFHFGVESYFDEEKDDYIQKNIVKLTDDNIRKRLRRKIDRITLSTKNDQKIQLPILQDNIYNYFLPEQIVPIEGCFYRILSMDTKRVFAEEASVSDIYSYYPCSEFVFSNLKLEDECVDTSLLNINIYSTDAKRIIYGYWDSSSDMDGSFLKTIHMNTCVNADGSLIVDTKYQVPLLEISLRRTMIEGDSEKAGFLAAFLIQGFLKTLFPKTWMNLYVISKYSKDDSFWRKVQNDSSNLSESELLHSMVPFTDVVSEKENEEYYSFYILENSSLEMGMLSALYGNRTKLFTLMKDYLEWYSDKGTALNVGNDKISDCFDLEGLLSFCKRIIPDEKEQPIFSSQDEDILDAEYTCSFCGKPVVFAYVMDDGRKMCRSCKQQQISQKKEISEVYLTTVEFIEKTYNIVINKKIHVKLQSAKRIKAASQSLAEGRVLGFYNNSKHELWIETRGPRIAVQDTMIHELTHAWQFENLNMSKLNRLDPEERLRYLEGHAVYMEIDVLKKLGEEEYAAYVERTLMTLNTVYGDGYRMLKEYLDNAKSQGSHYTPFEAMKELIDKL